MISILMPLFNGLNFLHDSISSIMVQTYKNWELLIGVNGYSKEEFDIIKGWISTLEDNRIKVIYCEIKGKILTLNFLKKYAKYNYICLIDVDDYWYPEKLEKQLTFHKRYDVIGTDCVYFGDRVDNPKLFLGKLEEKMFTFQNPLVNSSVLLKKEDAAWEETWEGLDDYNLWIYLLKNNKTFFNIPEVLIKHRIHENSYFNNKNEEKRIELVKKLISLNNEDYKYLGKIIENKEWKI